MIKEGKVGDAALRLHLSYGQTLRLLLLGDLKGERRGRLRDGLFVFHHTGEPLRVGEIRWAWKRATKRAGLVGRLVHDLRRSAARDFRRAGVSEGEVMRLCGWQTRSTFDRYNIIDEDDLARSVAKRFGTGQQLANNSESAADANRLAR